MNGGLKTTNLKVEVQREEANCTYLLHFPWSCIVYADGTLGMKMSAIVSSSQQLTSVPYYRVTKNL